MPGIFGFTTRMPHGWALAKLQRMAETLRHEQFYAEGALTDESAGIYIGWTARQDSADATMPLCNERGDVTLIFSGEQFPAPDTRRELKEKGHTIQPGS